MGIRLYAFLHRKYTQQKPIIHLVNVKNTHLTKTSISTMPHFPNFSHLAHSLPPPESPIEAVPAKPSNFFQFFTTPSTHFYAITLYLFVFHADYQHLTGTSLQRCNRADDSNPQHKPHQRHPYLAKSGRRQSTSPPSYQRASRQYLGSSPEYDSL